MKNKNICKNILNWIPRILGILLVLFFAIFALDTTDILGFLIQLIPAVIILIVTICSWKNKLVGMFVYLLLGAATLIFFNSYKDIEEFLIITLPFIVIGIFNLIYYFKYNFRK